MDRLWGRLAKEYGSSIWVYRELPKEILSKIIYVPAPSWVDIRSDDSWADTVGVWIYEDELELLIASTMEEMRRSIVRP